MHLLRISAIAVLCLLLNAHAAENGGKPSVRVTVREGSGQAAAGLLVEALDAEGLDSLDIQCPEADSNYHTQLSRSAADRQFRRWFLISELYPSLGEWKTALRVEVTVRNTRGAVASAMSLISPTGTSRKGN